MYPRLFRSLGHQMGSTIRRLAISGYHPCFFKSSTGKGPEETGIGECSIFQILSCMKNLRTLVLVDCHDLHFIRALDPEENPSNLILCSNMAEIVFYKSLFEGERLVMMAKNRASKGVKLSSITIVGRGYSRAKSKEPFGLKEYVNRAECKPRSGANPGWDYVPGESNNWSGFDG